MPDLANQEQAWGPRTDAPVDADQDKEMRDVRARAGSLGVSRTYAYCWWDNTDYEFGLTRRDGSLRPAALHFTTV